MDAALQSHKEIVRAKVICQVCGTRCGSVHAQKPHLNGASTSAPVSSIPPPSSGSPAATGTAGVGTSTPTAKEKPDVNIYFECTNCQKKIASNRYAPHLSGCLGLGTGSRRGAARNAAAKNKLGADADRGGSPYVGSEYGSPSLDVINAKGKGKAKNSKKINGKANNELNGSHKRPNTPDSSPAKKVKKQKTSIGELFKTS
ncbi:hypothetical protein K439DRAFT_1626493 [Ramaria rubella]|nr:hypothetical protein K439DRAFT_1626493 [Ramaria rubella]